jgi:hypothetical protein
LAAPVTPRPRSSSTAGALPSTTTTTTFEADLHELRPFSELAVRGSKKKTAPRQFVDNHFVDLFHRLDACSTPLLIFYRFSDSPMKTELKLARLVLD